MSILAKTQLQQLQLPLAISQQLADLRYRQGLLSASSSLSTDLLAGMAVKSQLSASKIMAAKDSSPNFNYSQALSYLSTIKAQPLSCALIKALHQQLNPQGGRWRSVKLKVSRRDQPDKQLLVPAGQEAIAAAMELLVSEFNQAIHNGVEPLVAIPLLLMELMKTFPFFDGNRRLALLLARQLLDHQGYDVVNTIDLESEMIATERAFYRSLNHSDSTNPIPWLSYWWVLIRRLYQRFDRQIQHANISPGRGSKTALIERFVKQQQHPFRYGDVCRAFPTISNDHIRMILRSLKERHIILTEGKGRGAVWRLC
ncbi:MAG: Fic family protein [Oceanicoccus sp.]|nr:Fic family protein [Oceanicoccus sp.]MCP3909060.1 Fic family protein [Oceanicoccus sp.]MDG1772900.1 Fic family protein [Oceanicoccus sp.]